MIHRPLTVRLSMMHSRQTADRSPLAALLTVVNCRAVTTLTAAVLTVTLLGGTLLSGQSPSSKPTDLDLGVLDQAVLDRVVAVAQPLISEATGVDVAKLVKFRLALRKDIQAILLEDSKEMAGLTTDQKPTGAMRVQARTLSKMILGKYDWRKKEVVLCPANFRWQAKAMKEPSLNSEGAFRAVMIHECVHAADDKRFGWPKTITTVGGVDKIQVFNAVIEGHAQMVTERICAENGWSKGFATYVSMIGAVTPNATEAQKLGSQIITANLKAAYRDGIRFMKHVHEKRGAKGVAQAFAKPPAEFESILFPEWFLDPSQRPTKLYELDPSVKYFKDNYGKEGYRVVDTKITGPQLKAAVALLGDEDANRLAKHLRFNKMAVIVHTKSRGQRMMVAGMYEFSSPAEATFYRLAFERLIKIKTEKIPQVLESRFRRVERADWRGIAVDQDVDFGTKKTLARSFLGVRGAIAVELIFQGEPIEPGDLDDLAEKMLSLSVAKSKSKSDQKANAPTSRRAPSKNGAGQNKGNAKGK